MAPSQPESSSVQTGPSWRRAGEVGRAFLGLGFTSFGGPTAHIGYFREAFVVRRRWLDDAGFADLVALCQFLPGPASSQVGFGIGLMRGGVLGAFAAWAAFTLPSALVLIAFAFGASAITGPVGDGVLHGLKLVAVAIVAHAVRGMAASLAPDLPRRIIALSALGALLIWSVSAAQVAVILIGAMAGIVFCRAAPDEKPWALHIPLSPVIGGVCLLVFFALLVGLPILASDGAGQGLMIFDRFYRAGALVFGGGHVVLPLLEAETVAATDWVSQEEFLAGYGAAQAVPGPLFTFAAYLGAVSAGMGGAAIALIAIFLPGFLLLVGILPFWSALRSRPGMQAAMRGTNAAVVGLLAAAWINPILMQSVGNLIDAAIVIAGFAILAYARLGLGALFVVVVGASILQSSLL